MNHRDALSRYGTLYACYRFEARYYLLIFLFRKVALVAVSVLLRPTPFWCIWTILILLVLFSALHHRVHPYTSKVDNFVSSLFLNILILVASLETVNTVRTSDDLTQIGSIQSLMVIVAFLVGVGLYIVEFSFNLFQKLAAVSKRILPHSSSDGQNQFSQIHSQEDHEAFDKNRGARHRAVHVRQMGGPANLSHPSLHD